MAFTKEQLEVVMHDDGDILVSASAGSGKTHTMIERLKRLIIQKGVSVNQVLAVTFTEAAATDMKEKLKSALSDAVNGKLDDEIYGSVDASVIEKLKYQLSEVATADISTMHSFCGRLIRSYFFAVGVSPDFNILDQTDSSVLKNLSIEQTFKEFYEQGEPWFKTLVDRHAVGRMDGGLKQLILSAHEFCDSEAYPDKLKNKYLEIYTEESLNNLLHSIKLDFNKKVGAILDACRQSLAVFERDGLIKGTAFAKALISDIEFALNKDDVYAIKSMSDYKLRLDCERKLTALAEESKQILKSCRDKFAKLLKTLLQPISDNFEDDLKVIYSCREHTAWFVKVLDRFEEIYAKEKLENNSLDFNDLEHYALKILEQEEYRKEISARYKYVFIDEFQDTNGVQDKIVSLIANDNLFMVGDDKQSIYGFRGSNSKYFTDKLQSMSQLGQKIVRLNHNFRSAGAVINMVNAIFDHSMDEIGYGFNYRENSRLVSGEIYPEGAVGRAEIHFLEKSKSEKKEAEEPRIYDVLEEKIELVENDTTVLATLVADIIEKERGKQFYDSKTKEFRTIDYKDVAVLARSKNSKYVADLVSGLIRNGVPVSAEVKENVCDYAEIQMMISALKLVDCFEQDFPLVSTLKSPICAMSEEQLFDIARFYEDNAENKHGGFFDAYKFYLEKGDDQNIRTKLLEFDTYFKQIRLIADFVGAHGVLNKLITEKNLEAYLFAQKQGVNKVDRLRRLVSASVVGGRNLSVKEFLERVKTSPDSFGLSSFAKENTVKIMTIHASKGLEFPVVIVCGLECAFNSQDERDEILLSRDYGFAVKYYDDDLRIKKDTLLCRVIKNAMAEERVKEEMRLFYVATTRATYSLHLTVCAKEDIRGVGVADATCFANFIPEFLPVTERNKEEIELGVRIAEPRKVYLINPDQAQVEKMEKDYAFSYVYDADTLLPLKASVTSTLNKDKDENEHYTRVLTQDDDKTDVEKGVIAHKIFELYDFESDLDIKEQTTTMVKNGLITQEQLNKVNLDRLNNVLKGGAFDNIKGKTLLRERAFLVNVEADKILQTTSKENVLLQGVIDLLVIDGDSAQVIDYKYSTLNKDGIIKTYKKQLDLYAYAVQKGLNKSVTRKTIINVYTGETVTID